MIKFNTHACLHSMWHSGYAILVTIQSKQQWVCMWVYYFMPYHLVNAVKVFYCKSALFLPDIIASHQVFVCLALVAASPEEGCLRLVLIHLVMYILISFTSGDIFGRGKDYLALPNVSVNLFLMLILPAQKELPNNTFMIWSHKGGR